MKYKALLYLIIIISVITLFVALNQYKEQNTKTKVVDCYDANNNVIMGVQCEEPVFADVYALAVIALTGLLLVSIGAFIIEIVNPRY